MSDYQHDNPYATPIAADEPAQMTVPEMGGIWRDGDELVMLSREAKPPKACWVTNRSGLVLRCPIVCDSPWVAVALLALHIPVVGAVLSILAAAVLTMLAKVPNYPTLGWISLRLWLIRLLIAVVVSASLMVAFFISIGGMVIGNPDMIIYVVALGVTQVVIYYFRDRAVLGLKGWTVAKGVVRLRGVHPDYLNRLPEYPGTGPDGRPLEENVP